ncbi:hypothetical protein GT459_03240 [Collinsella sp. BIOML-A3]|nr:VanZ family protein [Collinsella sp. BIOML-A6]MZJ26855.1 hypothetical protein [Collinsella sp. BIOML-A2]MZJ28928.1 hypothetical protein [Collinsella sp. BIOML-A3]MZJ96421.1 hypothetical protein [Collinsella sp. BIOML-A6]
MDARGRVLSDKCIADGIPFEELPEGWAWARLSMLTANVHYGYTCKSSSNGHIKLLRITDIQNGHVDWNSVPYCAVDPKDYSTYLLKEGDILIARTGGTIGKSYFIRDKPPVSAFASYLIRAIPIKNEIVPYFKCYFESPAYWGQLIDASAGTGQPNVNAASIGRILIAIPPLAEQRRIVERVNELMPLVEEYGGLEDAREALDAALPGRLRKSVLQLAVRGGLVPQDPADEPAGALLDRIRGQRRQLVADGKAKAPKGGESIIFAGSDGRRYEKMLNAGMGNKFEFDKEIIMIPISDILIRSISGYVFMVPVFVLYFLWLKKLGRTQSFLHTAAVFVFGYYLFGLLTVTGIGFTSTMTFRPNISWTPFIGMITGPIDTILNIILFVPLGFFLPLLYKKYHHMKTVALTGFLFSLAVEIVQMFGWGSSDINDLMTNTAGACIGFLVYCLLSRILPANLKKQLQSSRVNAVAEVLLFAICTFAIMVTAQTWFVHDVLNVP